MKYVSDFRWFYIWHCVNKSTGLGPGNFSIYTDAERSHISCNASSLVGPASLVMLFREHSELCLTGFDPCHTLLIHHYFLTKFVNIILNSIHSFQMMNPLCLGYALVLRPALSWTEGLWQLQFTIQCSSFYLYACIPYVGWDVVLIVIVCIFLDSQEHYCDDNVHFGQQHVASIFGICYLLGLNFL